MPRPCQGDCSPSSSLHARMFFNGECLLCQSWWAGFDCGSHFNNGIRNHRGRRLTPVCACARSKYYHNAKTGESMWGKPAELMSEEERTDPFKSVWTELSTPEGCRCYHNRLSKVGSSRYGVGTYKQGCSCCLRFGQYNWELVGISGLKAGWVALIGRSHREGSSYW